MEHEPKVYFTLSYLVSRVRAVKWADLRIQRVTVRPSVLVCESEDLHSYTEEIRNMKKTNESASNLCGCLLHSWQFEATWQSRKGRNL